MKPALILFSLLILNSCSQKGLNNVQVSYNQSINASSKLQDLSDSKVSNVPLTGKFKELDKDRSNFLSANEIRGSGLPFGFADADENADQKISYPEFFHSHFHSSSAEFQGFSKSKAVSMPLTGKFKELDKDRSNFLSANEIRGAGLPFGFADADANADQKISYPEFFYSHFHASSV